MIIKCIFIFLLAFGFTTPIFAQNSSELNNTQEVISQLEEIKAVIKESNNIDNLNNIATKLEEMKSVVSDFNNDNKTTIWISVIISTTAIITAIVSATILALQTRHITRDVNARIRPIISRTNFEGRPSIELTQSKITINIINTGTLPALHIITRNYATSEGKPKEAFKNLKSAAKHDLDLMEESSGMKTALGPNEILGLGIDITKEQYTQGKDEVGCYFGLFVSYFDNNNKHYFYYLEGHFDHNYPVYDHIDMN